MNLFYQSLRILHIWDQAGMSCIWSKYLKKLGHESTVIKNAGDDPFGYFDFYHETIVNEEPRNFTQLVANMAKDYDVIHVNGIFPVIPKIREENPDTPIYLFYLGTDLRSNVNYEKRLECQKLATGIFYNDPDLINFMTKEDLKMNPQYMPPCVDTEIFNENVTSNEEKLAEYLAIGLSRDEVPKINEHLKNHNFKANYTFLPRFESFFKYSEMPNFLSRFDGYIDIKFNKYNGEKPFNFHSTTAMQMLALGRKVLDWNCEIVKGLKPENDPINCTKKLLSNYQH